MSEIDQTKLASAKAGNMTHYAQLVRDHGKAAVETALAAIEPDERGKRASDSERNPFRRGSPHFNVTEQGRLFRTDPALAARLASAAGVKIG
jgi:hypothetical protein